MAIQYKIADTIPELLDILRRNPAAGQAAQGLPGDLAHMVDLSQQGGSPGQEDPIRLSASPGSNSSIARRELDCRV